MKKIGYLLIAVSGNALGTALMNLTDVGMTAWGISALNTGNFFSVSLGTGFVILSVFFYALANIIRRKIDLKELVFSFLFLFSFAALSDAFINILPSMSGLHMAIRILINVAGLLVLLFSIAVHLKVKIAVHPMDVYLHELQLKLGVARGTYFAYFSAFATGIIFGLLFGIISGIGIGTVITLVTSGLIMKFYNEKILHKWMF